MIHDPISALQSRSAMLHVAELLHRIGNDYTRAILFASLRAANASNNEARSALNEVVNHLHAAAAMHRVLRPPSAAQSADLTNTIARLCRAQSDVSISAAAPLICSWPTTVQSNSTPGAAGMRA
jgi:two-component sensor histidine kinase